MEEKNNKQKGENELSDDQDEEALKVDEAKVDESKQVDFAKVEKRVTTTSGGSTGTVRCVSLLCFYLSSYLFVILSRVVSMSQRILCERIPFLMLILVRNFME